jgi:hypothetical protein
MKGKWVDNDKYIGPSRRERGGKRLLDRRRTDETMEPPPLHAVLRRLRVLLNDTSDTAARERALQLFAASAKTATKLSMTRCAAALARAEQAFQDGDLEDAEALVAEALSYAV